MVQGYNRSGWGGDVDGDIFVKSWKEDIEEDLGEMDGEDELMKEEFIVKAKFDVKFVISRYL